MAGSEFDQIIDRRNTASLKWEKYRDRDIIPMWLADMDFRAPQPVIDALHQRVDHGVFGYPVASDEMYETVIEMLANRYDWKIEPDWLVWLPGLVTGLNVACRAVGKDGDNVMTAIPVYPPFISAPRYSRRGLVKMPLVLENGRWAFDFDQLERSLTARTALFLLCSPHNPVGRVFDREELLRLAAICERHNVVICSDEIHCDLVLDEDRTHTPTAALDPDVARRTITLMAPSKTYNIPGLCCSFAVIPNDDLRRRFKMAMAGIVPEINLFGYTAAIAAYRHGGPWLRDVLAYLRGNRDLVTAAVEQMAGVSMTHVEATYLAWLDVGDLELERPVEFFENAGVGLSDGADYDGPDYLRLNFGCPRPLLKKALARMNEALKSL